MTSCTLPSLSDPSSWTASACQSCPDLLSQASRMELRPRRSVGTASSSGMRGGRLGMSRAMMLYRMDKPGYFAHPSAISDAGAEIGEGTRVWHFTHVMPGAVIGRECTIGQGCYIAGVRIGDRVRIQNNVSVYDGVTIEDGVFCGPSCVFT